MSDKPVYQQLVDEIRERIISGALAPGAKLDSEAQLMKDSGRSRQTVRAAINVLHAEGLVRSRRGVGHFVADSLPVQYTGRDRVDAMRKTGRIYPPGHFARIQSAELAPVVDHVAAALGIEVAELAIRRQRITFTADETPITVSTSWFDRGLVTDAPKLLLAERLVQGTPQYIAEQTGRAVATTHAQHAADIATDDEGAQLQIPTGSAVLRSRYRFLDQAGSIIEYGESTSLPKSWIYYEYAAGAKE